MSATPYTVQPGDTIQSIALTQTGDESGWQYLASINKLTSPYEVTPGQVLITEEPTVTASKWPTVGIGVLVFAALIWFVYDQEQDKKKEA